MPVRFRNYTAAVERAISQLGLSTPAVAWLPTDVGLTCANFDLPAAAPLGGVNSGFLYLSKLHIRSALTLSNVWFGVSGSASGSGSILAGVYSQAGNLLSDCGNVASKFTLASFAKCGLTVAQPLTTWVWVALLSLMSGAQAQPVGAGSNAGVQNLALPTASSEYACDGTSFAALPPNLNFSNMATFAGAAKAIWVGGS